MKVKNFHGFQSLKEVECSGTYLPNEVNFLSLTLYQLKENKYSTNKKNSLSQDSVLASLLTSPERSCRTFKEYSSCKIDDTDRRKSVVKTLVSDLEGGESTTLGCNITAVFITGHDQVFIGSWKIDVKRESKF